MGKTQYAPSKVQELLRMCILIRNLAYMRTSLVSRRMNEAITSDIKDGPRHRHHGSSLYVVSVSWVLSMGHSCEGRLLLVKTILFFPVSVSQLCLREWAFSVCVQPCCHRKLVLKSQFIKFMSESTECCFCSARWRSPGQDSSAGCCLCLSTHSSMGSCPHSLPHWLAR